jgi:hypothetical protein
MEGGDLLLKTRGRSDSELIYRLAWMVAEVAIRDVLRVGKGFEVRDWRSIVSTQEIKRMYIISIAFNIVIFLVSRCCEDIIHDGQAQID